MSKMLLKLHINVLSKLQLQDGKSLLTGFKVTGLFPANRLLKMDITLPLDIQVSVLPHALAIWLKFIHYILVRDGYIHQSE